MRILALISFIAIILGFDANAQNMLPGIPYRSGDSWGIANKFNREILVEPIYDSVYVDRTNRIMFTEMNNKLGAIHFDRDKKTYSDIIDPQFDFIEYTTKGLIVGHHTRAEIQRMNRMGEYFQTYENPLLVGFVSLTGEELLKPEYKFIRYEKDFLLLHKEFGTCAVFAIKSKKILSEFDLEPVTIYLLSQKEIERRKNEKKNGDPIVEMGLPYRNTTSGFKDKEGRMFYFKNDSLILVESDAYEPEEDLEDIMWDDQEETMFNFSKDELQPYNVKYVHLEDDFRFSPKKSKVQKKKFYQSNFRSPDAIVVKESKSNSLGLFYPNSPSITQLIYDSVAVLPTEKMSDYSLGDINMFRRSIERIETNNSGTSQDDRQLKRQQIQLAQSLEHTDSTIFSTSHFVLSKNGLKMLAFNDSVQTALQYKNIVFHDRHQCIELTNTEGLMTLYFKDLQHYESFNIEYTTALKDFDNYLTPIGPFASLTEASGYMRLKKEDRRTRKTEQVSPFRSYLVQDQFGDWFYIGNNGLVFYDY